ETEDVVAHTVRSGSMILAPVGYHPTVASPGTRNAYLWVLAAHSHESRRYDLAVEDPCYCGT
ncbi:MAG: 5-deoxy-glucuronate isomerase, partial [Pseudoflavonifractor sp.]